MTPRVSPQERATLRGVNAAPVKLDARSLAAIALTILFWASSYTGVHAGLTAFTPGALALYRFLSADVVLFLYVVVMRVPLPEKGDVGRISLLSLLGITLYHVILNYGQLSVPAGTASLLIATGPVITALFAWRFFGERLNALGWLGTFISLAGVTLIVLGRGQDVKFTQGALLILGCALLTSLYFVFQKPLITRMKPLHFTIWSLLLGTVPLLIFLPQLLAGFGAAPLGTHLWVIYLGVFPSALAYVLWTYALSRLPAGTVTSFLFIAPVFAILIAWGVLGEFPSRMTLLGGAVAIAGVALVNLLGRPKVEPKVGVS